MPPKKGSCSADKGPSKKTEDKKKAKVVEDKTFGLKNKKGKKQQVFIKTVEKQVKHGDKKSSDLMKEQEAKNKAKLDKIKQKEELNNLFRPVDQKVAKGVDPKSVLCAFFKQGSCGKGAKCKFSHDVNIERKGAKKNIYEDEAANADAMDDWDEEKLEEVINKKHGEKNKGMPTTTIVCKFFLDAVENYKYGWFWQCPTGESCHYKHALPPGFVLKRDKKKAEENKEEVSMEDLVEKERAALSSKNLTKVTLESFLRWKERKRVEKLAKKLDEVEKRKGNFKEGKTSGISGREMFEFNPELGGDDEEADDTVYTRQDNEEDDAQVVRELTLEMLAENAQSEVGNEPKTNKKIDPVPTLKPDDTETAKLSEAAALPLDPNVETDAAISAAMAAVDGLEIGDTVFDENLFDGEDLDLVEDELDELELDD